MVGRDKRARARDRLGSLAITDASARSHPAIAPALALRAAAAGLPLTHLVLHDAPYNGDEPDARAVSQAYRRELEAMIGHGRPDDATQLFLRIVGTPDDAIAGMRTEPWWPSMVARAPTLLHDSEVMVQQRRQPA